MAGGFSHRLGTALGLCENPPQGLRGSRGSHTALWTPHPRPDPCRHHGRQSPRADRPGGTRRDAIGVEYDHTDRPERDSDDCEHLSAYPRRHRLRRPPNRGREAQRGPGVIGTGRQSQIRLPSAPPETPSPPGYRQSRFSPLSWSRSTPTAFLSAWSTSSSVGANERDGAH